MKGTNLQDEQDFQDKAWGLSCVSCLSLFNVRMVLMIVALFALVYFCFAGKGTVMGPVPLMGVVTVLTEGEISKRLKRKQGESASAHLLRIKGVIAENARLVKEGVDANIAANREETDDQVLEFNNLTAEREAAIALHRTIELAAGEAGNIDGRNLSDDDREIPHHSLPGGGRERKSYGQRFVEDKQIREWMKAGYPVAGGGSPRVILGDDPREQQRLLVSGEPFIYNPTGAGAFILPDRRPGVESYWARPLSVLELIQMGTTASTSVEHIRETFTNNAGMIAEATGVGDGSGASPSSVLDFAIITDTVKDIAHDVPITNNALRDAGQVRSRVDGALIQGAKEKVEDQVLAGDGTGNNFKGILAHTGGGADSEGINIQAFDTGLLDTYRKALTKIRTEGKIEPNSYVISAQADEDLDLAKNLQGTFYAMGAPFGTTPATLWGRPRAVSLSSAVSVYSLLGAWSKAWLFEHVPLEIYVFEQHSDWAKRRLTLIMAVWRAAFKVYREPAFCRIALS